MSTTTYILDSQLNSNAAGNITTYNSVSFDGVKQKIQLYLTINTGEIPFSSFGNDLITQLFYVNNQTEASLILNSLISNVNNFLINSNITVTDYSVAIDRVNRSLNLTLNLSDNTVLNINL